MNVMVKIPLKIEQDPSLNTQSCNRRPLCSTFTFENVGSPKKTQFYSKKVLKKCPQKLLIIRPQLFLSIGLAAQTAQKQKSRTSKSPLMQDWVFRLGSIYVLLSALEKETLQICVKL